MTRRRRASPRRVHHDREREVEELRAYLGPKFDRSRLECFEQQLRDEFERTGDEDAFYRSSEGYLYDLTAFAWTQAKLPYLRDLARHLPSPARVLDYGCGIGSDGLCLIEAGYAVTFADFDNPSTRYLRWHLARRGLQAEVYDLDRRPPPGGFEAVYAFDVIEHVHDPFDLLRRLEAQAPLVLVNFLEPDYEANPLHRDLPIQRLLAYAARRRLLHYRRYHGGRSHLVLYRREPARGVRRGLSAARRLRGRIPAA